MVDYDTIYTRPNHMNTASPTKVSNIFSIVLFSLFSIYSLHTNLIPIYYHVLLSYINTLTTVKYLMPQMAKDIPYIVVVRTVVIIMVLAVVVGYSEGWSEGRSESGKDPPVRPKG